MLDLSLLFILSIIMHFSENNILSNGKILVDILGGTLL